MSQPTVDIKELDGALGIVSASFGKLHAVIGVCSAGPFVTPAAFGSSQALATNFGIGPAVEAAAYYIEKYSKPVIIVRSQQTTPGAYPAGAVTVRVGAGTSVATADILTEPDDDYEPFIKIVAGGTIATAGITFQWSLDGGRTLSPVTALGAATFFVFPNSGGIKVLFAAGTLIAGETIYFRASAPKWNTADIQAALSALFATITAWENVHITGDLLGADIDTIDPVFVAGHANGKDHGWIASVRMPNLGEDESAYRAAMETILSSKSTVHGEVCAGAAKTISSLSGRQYRRPVAHCVAAMEAGNSEEVNIADVNLGAVPGVSIRDAQGNPDEHDESLNPGLDDLRCTVLRTWEGIEGVYVNRPRVLSPSGSDFDLFTKRRVMNLAHSALRPYLIRRLNKPILVDRKSGFILEEEALEIEAGGRAAMRRALLAKPKASGISFTISRTDNLLSTKLMNAEARVIPLAYVEFISMTLGFLNPANVVAVG